MSGEKNTDGQTDGQTEKERHRETLDIETETRGRQRYGETLDRDT